MSYYGGYYGGGGDYGGGGGDYGYQGLSPGGYDDPASPGTTATNAGRYGYNGPGTAKTGGYTNAPVGGPNNAGSHYDGRNSSGQIKYGGLYNNQGYYVGYRKHGGYSKTYGYGEGKNAKPSDLTDNGTAPAVTGYTSHKDLGYTKSGNGADIILAGAKTILADEKATGFTHEAGIALSQSFWDSDQFSYKQVLDGPTVPNGERGSVYVASDFTIHGHLSSSADGYPDASPADLQSLANGITDNAKAYSAVVDPSGNISVYATKAELNNLGLGYSVAVSNAPHTDDTADHTPIPQIYVARLNGK